MTTRKPVIEGKPRALFIKKISTALSYKNEETTPHAAHLSELQQWLKKWTCLACGQALLAAELKWP